MTNKDKTINKENAVEEVQFNETISAEEETIGFEIKIPSQYKALQDAARTGARYCEEVDEDNDVN